jgi:hypothetical protein
MISHDLRGRRSPRVGTKGGAGDEHNGRFTGDAWWSWPANLHEGATHRQRAAKFRLKNLERVFPFSGDRFISADKSRGFVPGVSLDLLHDAVNVVLDGELREIQVRRDFFVA